MSQPPAIRPAQTADAARLSELSVDSKAYWGYSAEFMAACHAELQVSAETIAAYPHYVLLQENKIIGFYALKMLNSAEIELEALFLDPAYIGQGYGRLLIEDAKKNARLLKASRMIIVSDPNAKSFYIAAGGAVTSESPSGSIPGRYLPTLTLTL